MPESHTGINIACVLKEAVIEWSLPPNPPLVSDNASNMIVAAAEFQCSFHVGCLAHTLNLACGKALKIGSVSTLLARMRRVVAYFHRSTVATAILKEKQKLLQLPEHKLVIDVSTRWNSALDMINRYLEQQPAIYAALTSRDLRGRDSGVATMSERDITSAEELVVVLTPLKVATTALCEESVPTVSIILPLQHQLLNHTMEVNEDDTPLIKQVKCAIVSDLSGRYQDTVTKNNLTVATLLDPRFKSAPFLSDADRLDAYHDLTMQAMQVVAHLPIPVPQPEEAPEVPEPPEGPEQINLPTPLAAKKRKQSAMTTLFGTVYSTSGIQQRSQHEICEAEVSHYRKEPPIDPDKNPLIWWSHQCHKYPVLSVIAKKYLCIPATSVPSERVFSTAGDIVTAQRSQLKSEHVDRLIFLKKNWKT